VTFDRRYLAPLLITCILVVGQLTAGFLESGSRTALAIGTAIMVEALLGRLFSGRWPHLASAYVSGISVGILVRSPEVWPYAVCAALAITSKYLIRLQGRHIWNPSNFSIVMLLVLAPEVVASLSVQWGNHLWAMVPVWCVGALVLSSLGRFHITATYVISFVVLAGVRALWTGDPWLAEVAPITGPMYQLFACFMVTDPKTTVTSRQGQVVVVVMVALCEAVLRSFEVVHAPYYALFLVGPAANLYDIMRTRPRTVPAVAALVLVMFIGSGCRQAAPAEVPPSVPASTIVFEDITRAAGINFVHQSGASGRMYFVEQWGSGAAFLDVDQDGWIDLFLAQGGALPGSTTPGSGHRLYRNLGTGRFADVTADSGLTRSVYTLGVAVGDYDNDGDPDLFTTTVAGAVLYRNDGRGRFEDVTSASGIAVRALATSAAFLDYDTNGRLDIVVARYQDYDLATDQACRPAHNFPPPQHTLEYCGPGRPPVGVVLLHNEGDGRFRDVSRSSGVGSAVARGLGVMPVDLNGDALVDIVVASDRAPNLLLQNQGNGRFRDVAAAAGIATTSLGAALAGMGVDAADIDNDGWSDLVITNYEQEPVTVFRNAANELLQEESDAKGLTPLVFKFMKWGVRALDLDGDARRDLVIANGHLFPHLLEGTPLGLPIEQTRKGFAQEAQVLRQGADGRWTDVSLAAGPFFSERRVFRGLASADIDNDGDWDVLLTAIDGPPALLRNGAVTRRWAGLQLEGTVSNRDALGAVVVVRSTLGQQAFHIGSGGSYLSDHDRRVIVSLDESEDAVAEIRWPCGATTRTTLSIGRYTRAVESGCAK
jgi:Na+-translocating ferredoxin:NAD+ oxidoreductase RnfD subunit